MAKTNKDNNFAPDKNRQRQKLGGKRLKKFHEEHNRLKVKRRKRNN